MVAVLVLRLLCRPSEISVVGECRDPTMQRPIILHFKNIVAKEFVFDSLFTY